MERGELRGNSMPFQNYSHNGNSWSLAGNSQAADNHNPCHNPAAGLFHVNENSATEPHQNPAASPFHAIANPATSPYHNLATISNLARRFYPSDEDLVVDPYYDQLNSLFSRLTLTQPHLSIRDIQQMRVESAAIYQMNVGAVDFTPHRSWYNSDGRNFNRNTGTRPRQRPNGGAQPLEHLGRIFSMAKDQKAGSKYKFIDGKPEEIQMIFMEIKDHACELMVHPSGNYLMQRFFEVCNQDQITHLLMLLTHDHLQFISICNHTHGTRAVQKLLQHLETSEQKYRIIYVLRRITVALSENINGSHIIHYCVKNFTVDQIEDILNIIADNCLDMATDQYGCVVLQTCLGKATGVPRDRLLADISSNALMLSENSYGNYVVQYVFGMNSEDIRDNIMAQLCGNFVSLSMNKFASHVVEKCLKRPKQRQIVMQEIIGSPYLLRLLQDRYGNYVVQLALEQSQGEELHKIMNNMIMMNTVNLHSHPYGQRVLKKAKGSKSRGTCDCASLTCPFIYKL